ncbi:MAG: energy transducer TonB [Acidobacteriota bacterium]|nr:energy transducer TonB [Acidobacteriota bacterium]
MASASSGRPGPDEYLVCDLSTKSGSILLNLELADALRKVAGRRSGVDAEGILLGRILVTGANRTLITVEDCEAIHSRDNLSKDNLAARLEFWRGKQERALAAIGLVRVTHAGQDRGIFRDAAIESLHSHFGRSPGVVLVIERVRGAVPVGHLFWSGLDSSDNGNSWTEIPLDSVTLKAAGFSILQGSPAVELNRARIQTGIHQWRKWAWIPLAAALFSIAAATFWTAYRPAPEPPLAAEIIEPKPALEPTPSAAPAAPAIQVPRQRARVNRDGTPNTPVVIIEWHSAPEPVTRKLASRGIPWIRRFRRDSSEFIQPVPTVQIRPAIPRRTAEAFPGEWRVNLRLTLDKSGRLMTATLLNPNANREFVRVAKNAIERWRFQPARLQKRPVPGALDVTFQFHPVGR